MIDSKQALIIVNPVSGPGKATDRKQKLETIARSFGWQGEIVETSKKKNAGEIAAAGIKKGITHIVACGGDGTIMEVLSEVVNKPIVVGIVPLGTGNLFAQNLNLPVKIENALHTALFGTITKIDVGQANGTYFSIITGMGLDADMIKKADRDLKNKLGIFAYIIALIQSLKKPRERYRISVDNKEEKIVKAKSIIVANMGRITGGIKAVPHAHPQNGTLHIGVIQANSFRSWLSIISNTLLKGDINKSSKYTLLKGTNIVISPLSGPQVYECDGELFPPTAALKITIIPTGVTILT